VLPSSVHGVPAKKKNKAVPQNTTTSITKSAPQTTIIKKNKTQTGYRNRTKEKEGGRRIDRSLRSFKPLQPTICHHSQIKTNVPNKNRRTKQGNEREDKPEPSPTAVAEPDQIVLSGRREITLLPPSQP
jgi:hypothetical protein